MLQRIEKVNAPITTDVILSNDQYRTPFWTFEVISMVADIIWDIAGECFGNRTYRTLQGEVPGGTTR